MNQELYQKIKEKTWLAALTDLQGNVLWKAEKSPAGAAYQAYFRDSLPRCAEGMVLYANQAGMAFATLGPKVDVRQCYAVQVSAPGLDWFQKNGISVEFEEKIPLVRSSKDETKVCPVEQFLVDHADEKEKWEFLMEKFGEKKEER